MDVPEVGQLCNLLVQTYHKGAASTTERLAEMAESVRRERVIRAENYANQMSSKILFPILIFIFPAVVIALLGPMILKAWLQFQGTGI